MTGANRSRLSADPGGAWRLYWGAMPLPAGMQSIGTITRGVGDTGALLRTAIGLYAQGNAGVLRTLDKRKVAAALDAATHTLGGARPGAGRPDIGAIRKNVTLDQSSICALRALGDGDLSRGIRRAATQISGK